MGRPVAKWSEEPTITVAIGESDQTDLMKFAVSWTFICVRGPLIIRQSSFLLSNMFGQVTLRNILPCIIVCLGRSVRKISIKILFFTVSANRFISGFNTVSMAHSRYTQACSLELKSMCLSVLTFDIRYARRENSVLFVTKCVSFKIPKNATKMLIKASQSRLFVILQHSYIQTRRGHQESVWK